MATATVTQAHTNNSDANFRLWGKWISDQLAAWGWTKTSDSGQINWATVTAPVGTSAVQGYEVWSLGDALQATAPVKVKIEYGSGSNVNWPSTWVTIGSTSDGAGNITGPQTARKQVANNSHSTTGVPSHAAGGTSWATFCIWDTSTSGWTFVMERTKDASGADTAYGFNVALVEANAGIFWQQTYVIGVSPMPAEASIACLLPSSGTLTKGGVVQLSAVFPIDGNWLNPFLTALCGFAANLTASTTVSFNMYGASHTYFVSSQSCNCTKSNVGGVVMLILYE